MKQNNNQFYYDPPGYSYGNINQTFAKKQQPNQQPNQQSSQQNLQNLQAHQQPVQYKPKQIPSKQIPPKQIPQAQCGYPYPSETSIISQSNKDEYKYSVKSDPSIYLQDSSSIMKFPDVYGDREFFQAPQENLIDDPSWFLSIDSSDRDRSKYPNPFKYTIYMVGTSDQQNVTGHRYKNIHSIELISAILPNVEEITNELYIILQIDELRDVGFNSSNQNLQQAYAKLVMHHHLNDNFLLLDADNSRPLKRIYYPSLKGSIDKLTITLKKPNGDIIDLGSDSDPDQPPIKDIQNSFTFRIISKIPDVDAAIGHRNI